jgi:hypothetical protein
VTIVLALWYVGLAAQVITIVAVVMLIIVLMYFIVGIRDQVSNTVAGFRIHRKQFMQPGKSIKVQNISGTVVSSTLTDTIVKTPSGDTLYIPNRILADSIVEQKRGTHEKTKR